MRRRTESVSATVAAAVAAAAAAEEGAFTSRNSETAASIASAAEPTPNLQDRQGPASAAVIRLRKVATAHVVVVSGLELALSLTNALEEDAFRFDSSTNKPRVWRERGNGSCWLRFCSIHGPV